MRNPLLLVVLCFTFCVPLSAGKRFALLSASYNNEEYAEWSLMSAFSQDYDDYHIYYINDCSTDRTLEIVREVVAREGKEEFITIIDNPERMGAMANHYNTIHERIADDDIIVILDGDDALAHEGVLSYLNEIYTRINKEVWMTYGQFIHKTTGEIGFCHRYEPRVFEEHLLRKKEDIPSHLRTYYSWLFKKVDKEDFMFRGKFMTMCADMAAMLPMAEMCTLAHLQFISEVLYIYNDENPINDHRKSKREQLMLYHHIKKLSPYKPL